MLESGKVKNLKCQTETAILKVWNPRRIDYPEDRSMNLT
jgi:hypothetical protein